MFTNSQAPPPTKQLTLPNHVCDLSSTYTPFVVPTRPSEAHFLDTTATPISVPVLQDGTPLVGNQCTVYHVCPRATAVHTRSTLAQSLRARCDPDDISPNLSTHMMASHSAVDAFRRNDIKMFGLFDPHCCPSGVSFFFEEELERCAPTNKQGLPPSHLRCCFCCAVIVQL